MARKEEEEEENLVSFFIASSSSLLLLLARVCVCPVGNFLSNINGPRCFRIGELMGSIRRRRRHQKGEEIPRFVGRSLLLLILFFSFPPLSCINASFNNK